MCTPYSAWQRLNKHRRDPKVVEKEKAKADEHLRFVCSLYMKQIKAGRYFLHEHPAQASSWQMDCIKEVMKHPTVDFAIMDQCQYGQQDESGQPIKKPTQWMSNSNEILKQLQNRCVGRGGWCSLGGRAPSMLGKHSEKSGNVPIQALRSYPHRMQEPDEGGWSHAGRDIWDTSARCV